MTKDILRLCCQCGTAIAPNAANMCEPCVRNAFDITDGIPKQAQIYFCKLCERYLQPPHSWVPAALESKELLTLCLKKLKGLGKVRLVDAGFVWTEPHSRRIKLKLTIQKEVLTSTILQQDFVVEFVVHTQQCEDCQKVMAQNTWRAVIQVRQKVSSHKRTMCYLEQLILKHNAHKDTSNIKEMPEGIDFFFAHHNQARKMLDFLKTIVPWRVNRSEQLVSQDFNSNEVQYKYTYAFEIAPISKDDLVCLPLKTARSCGNISQLVLCTRIGNWLHFLDPRTLQVCDMEPDTYWKTEFRSICASRSLVEYVVLDVDLLGATRGKHALCDVQVAKASDFGVNDLTLFVRSHLGNILKPGDYVLGYDLSTSNLNDENFDALTAEQIPDVVLVKKSYKHLPKKKQRPWKLRHMKKDVDNEVLRKTDVARAEDEYEDFLADLEEDKELRAAINIYRNPEISATPIAEDGAEEDDDRPDIPLDELLDDMTLQDAEAEPDNEPNADE